MTARCWFEIAALTPNNFTMEADGTLILDWSVARKTARADPHRASRSVRTRGRVVLDIVQLCRTLWTQRKAHESYDRPSRTSSGSLERAVAFHKTGCAEARCSNRGHIQFGLTRDLAVGDARRPVRPSPEYCSIFGGAHYSADPGVVAGRIGVKGKLRKGRNPG
ncbi:hypothetical protein TcCL_ESM10462 [Trypanosoma cruzi]|nr:hypothetical protein TcCL_ESM10462 [Trypanosoma cruzi]